MTKARYISQSQLEHSLRVLRNVHPYFGMAFLAFKQIEMPVGEGARLNFSALMRDFLERYYKPAKSYAGYYNPFRTSNPENRWVTAKYPSGSLQRITVDTFGQAIIHTKKKPFWGWRENYVDVLHNLQKETDTSVIPIVDLAIWLYRDRAHRDFEGLQAEFLAQFNVSENEHRLFDFNVPDVQIYGELVERRRTERQLFEIVGWPPGGPDNESMSVREIGFREVGPAPRLVYRPNRRLNLVTGDNSLGKTFLLDSVWWAITGHWLEYPAAPRRNAQRSLPSIRVTYNASGRNPKRIGRYDWRKQAWEVSQKPRGMVALSIYARHDGSFVVWDAISGIDKETGTTETDHLVLDRDSLWHGKRVRDESRGVISLCNGLLQDWVSWQTRKGRFEEVFGAFVKCLKVLSPPGGQALEVDEPISLAGNEQEIPALAMEYGAVPIVHASAGVKRIMGLTYVLIWAWFRHKRNAGLVGMEPFDQMILVVDEVEAHLHPRWQRAIVPALMEVVDVLSDDLAVQAHIATHSPLIMASGETVFDSVQDTLHHLELSEQSVTMSTLEFGNLGSVDAWLVSEVFGLKQARSLEAEGWIERAMRIQLKSDPSLEEVREADVGLRGCLRDDDEFWPRWRYFAQTIEKNRESIA